MSTEMPFRHRVGLLASLLLTSSALSVINVPAMPSEAELAAGNHNGDFAVHGIVLDDERRPIAQIPVLCWSNQGDPPFTRQAISGLNGEFTLTAIPKVQKPLRCWTGGGDLYEHYEDDLPVDGNTELVLTVSIKTIPTLQGTITSARGTPLLNARVEVTDATGTIVSARANDKGQVEFTTLKAGKAKVSYSAEGYESKYDIPLALSHRASLSTALYPASAPVGLLLLIPGILVLGLRAAIDLTLGRESHLPTTAQRDPEKAEKQHVDPNAWLILASLVSWGGIFLILCLWMRFKNMEALTFFDNGLSFSLFVPVCGFLGALIFLMDLFQQGHQEINAFREFAMRVLLAPYVAIVIVLFFAGTFSFIQLNNLASQAALAFFSGYMVVLFLQGLTERGNEVLGQWRAENRYEPSQIAAKFDLQREEDLKLRKANLKYVSQLQVMEDVDLKALGRQTDLGEGFLLGLKHRLSPDHLQARLGKETWEKLNNEGVRTVWDVALLTPERIQQISTKQNIDRLFLTRYYEDCQAFVRDLRVEASPSKRASMRAEQLATMHLAGTTS